MVCARREEYLMSAHLVPDNLANFLVAFFAAFLIALWFSLVLWTFRDIRTRTRDRVAMGLAVLLVFLFHVAGLLLYLLLRPSRSMEEAYQSSLEEETLLASLAGRVTCPGCSRTVEAEWIVCPSCSTRLRKPCATCKRPLELTWVICPFCATPCGSVEPMLQK
jgi:hypothetical protein